MNGNESLTIYFENGRTTNFEQITDVEINENDTLTFNYVDQKSQVKRWAFFTFDLIAGFSIVDDDHCD